MGEPFAVTAPSIRTAAAESLAKGRTKYTALTGLPELRQAVATALTDEVSRAVSPEEVTLTHGGSAGLAATMIALVRPGDRVIIQDPTYSLYADHLAMVGATPLWAPSTEDGSLDLATVDELAPHARMLVLCSPNNPTGLVVDSAGMAALQQLLMRHPHLLLLADEAYSTIVFDCREFTSALTLDSVRRRVVVSRTFSKAYAMTGWRLGYTVAAPEVAAAINLVHRTINGALNTFVQDAGIRAIQTSLDDQRAMTAEYQRRRDILVEALEDAPRVTLTTPTGAFYAFPRIASALTSDELVSRFAASGVLVRSGAEFGPSGEGYVRLSFATDIPALRTGLERFRATLEELDY